MAETLKSFPYSLLAKIDGSEDERKVLDFLGNKKADIFPSGKILEIHFQKREDRKAFEDLFPKVPNRKPRKK